MIKISVEADVSQLLRRMDIAKSQIPFATALALTKTAQAVKADLRLGMSASFQSVVAYTLNSMYVGRATKTDLVATVGVKGADTHTGASKWLKPEVFGGVRQRGIEAILRPANLPPSGMYAVPGKAAKMSGNRINISWLRSLVSDMLSQGVSGNVTKSNTRKRKGQGQLQYFVLLQPWGKLPAGIWGKRGRYVLPLIIFVRQPKYRAKFDFYGIAQTTAKQRFPIEFEAAAKRAMETAR
jgi:hypothetical protein